MLDDYGYDVFSLDMIRGTGLFTDTQIASAIWSLSKTGFIQHLERGKYIRACFNDDKIISNFMAPDGAIAYWTALNAHGLTEQFANKTFIRTALRKKEFIDKDKDFIFVKVPAFKLFGHNT